MMMMRFATAHAPVVVHVAARADVIDFKDGSEGVVDVIEPEVGPVLVVMNCAESASRARASGTAVGAARIARRRVGHQVLLEAHIDNFAHKDAGDAIAAVADKFPESDASDPDGSP
jgi:hypothetical protein